MSPFNFNAQRVGVTFFTMYFALLIMNCIAIFLYYHYSYTKGFFFYLEAIFNFGKEHNLPTYFNALLFIFCAQCFFIIKQISDKLPISLYIKSYWLFISFVFLFLGADELLEIHETFIYFTSTFLKNVQTGYLTFAWVIPYALIVLFFALYSIKFLFYLPKKFRVVYLLCGFTYILGAIGVELIEAKLYDESGGQKTMLFFVYTTIEESLEMLSLVTFLYYNILYINFLTNNELKAKQIK